MNLRKTLFLFGILLAITTSCTTVHRTMREPNVRVDLTRNDFVLSEQVSAEATSKRILGIDFERLFKKNAASIQGGPLLVDIASLPVVGTLLVDPTANYALYVLMSNNPGYDVIFYPQYETTIQRPFLGLGFIYRVTTVKTTARLGKLN